MKKLLILVLATLCFETHAQSIKMENFPWTMNDISDLGLKKEDLFKEMDRDFIKLGKSICANRALMWLHDFKQKHDIDGSKVFVFYTAQKSRFSVRTWWYHVAPIINEKGTEWVMDAGFSGKITSPILVKDWLHSFVGSNKCYEIRPADSDLIKMMHEGRQFPQETHRGKFDCYYAKAPAGYWFPSSLAKGLSGHDYQENPVQVSNGEIDKDEVYSACVEAVTGPLGSLFGSGKKKCRKYMGL